ncbi:MAG: two-component regulator propeller domain-containing protein, partial [Mucilaginibacter sp.]
MRKFKSCYLLALLLLFWISARVNAQTAINFTSITIKEGLSSNTVNAVIKDRFGMMWFGTANGLDKFDGSNFVIYRHQDGSRNTIPSNEVLSLFEDNKGIVWVGTSGGGLSYYDRKFDRFTNFKGDGSWPEVSTVSIRAICQDHEGKLWVGTYEDLRRIDPETGHITHVAIPNSDNKDMGSYVILSLFEDSKHRMWIGTNNGLYVYNWVSKSFIRFAFDNSSPGSISNNVIKSIIEDAKGDLWFATYDGLNKWAGSGHFKVFRHSDQLGQSLNNNVLFALRIAPDGKIWIGTEDGVNIFDPGSGVFQYLTTDPRNTGSLKSKSIRSIYIDRNGLYWIGTQTGGVGKYDEHLALFGHKKSDPFDAAGLKSPLVTAFAEGRNGEIFVGTDGGGIARLDKKSGLLYTYDVRSRLKSPGNQLSVLSLHLDKKGMLWAGTYHDGLFRIDPVTHKYEQFTAGNQVPGISVNDISSIAEDRDGRIWIGTLGHGIDVFDDKTHTFSHLGIENANGKGSRKLPINGYVASIVMAPGGQMWIGSYGTGILVFNPENRSWKLYNKNNATLADDVVSNLLIAQNGVVWAGTNQGLSCFDPRTQKFISYNERQGLANCFVKTILQDTNGVLWLSTDRGISSYDPEKNMFRNFTTENGVQQGAFFACSGIRTSDGNLYFGGQDGFNYFNPSKLPPVSRAGKVLISDLTVDNAKVNPGEQAPIKEQINTTKQIVLKYGQNFAISYVALDYTSPKQNQYAYRLGGFDKHWNYVHNSRTASYTNIDPGTYEFEVMASKDERVWNNPVTRIKVIILPPFWRTNYAYAAYLLMAGAGLFFIRQRGIQKIRRQFEQAQEKLHVKQLIEQERLEAERLHELDMLKIKFLTDLSHEFRTPVSLILAPVEKLLEKSRPCDDVEDLKMINRNGRRLLNLVNQLLDFRKMEEQKLKLNLLPGQITHFIIEACEAFRDLALKKQVTLDIEIEEDELFVLYDQDKLERIIFNLLSNAFKFTPGGGVVAINTQINEEGEKDISLILTVTDTGIGIRKDDQEKIFERFYQSRQNNAIINQGTGIGLSITKEFVELQGGNISVESAPGEGSMFTVTLPLAKALGDVAKKSLCAVVNNGTAIRGQAGAEEIAAQMPTILLVEDNEEFRGYLSDHLKKYYHIIEAGNGREGWQKTLASHVNLVVSDISMPHMNGIELSEKIKADKRTCHTPVILLTAMTGEEDELKGLQTGASDYLTKPFNFQILQTKIDNLLDLNRNLKDTYSKQIQLVG